VIFLQLAFVHTHFGEILLILAYLKSPFWYSKQLPFHAIEKPLETCLLQCKDVSLFSVLSLISIYPTRDDFVYECGPNTCHLLCSEMVSTLPAVTGNQCNTVTELYPLISLGSHSY
jgi:hypothetical protein